MTPREYQKLAMRTRDDDASSRLMQAILYGADQHTDTSHIIEACMGLSGEVGEMVDMFKKNVFHQKPLDDAHAVRELGDILWYIALICDAKGWDLEMVMELNIEKLRQRYPDGFGVERANNRKENDL